MRRLRRKQRPHVDEPRCQRVQRDPGIQDRERCCGILAKSIQKIGVVADAGRESRSDRYRAAIIGLSCVEVSVQLAQLCADEQSRRVARIQLQRPIDVGLHLRKQLAGVFIEGILNKQALEARLGAPRIGGG